MDLVVDIGNTHCHLAGFEAGRLVAKTAVRGGPEPEMVPSWEKLVASLGRPSRVGVASVNPDVKAPFVKWVKASLGLDALVLGETLRPKIELDVDAPSEVGADRLVNALWAARKLPGKAAIIVDFGTAISFDVVSSRGAFLGGAIAPGLGTQARALHEKTALLPLVSVARKPAPIGRDTVTSIESGIFFGAVGLVDLLSEKMREALGERALVLATGGDAELVAPASRVIERVVPDMTLEGVALALAES